MHDMEVSSFSQKELQKHIRQWRTRLGLFYVRFCLCACQSSM